MARGDFSIRAEGLRPVERRLGKLLKRFGDLLPLMERIGDFLENTTRERFETNIAPDGTPWKPSMRATLEGGTTLVKDGHLRDSITNLPSSSRVEIGTNWFSARVHQLGAVIKPVNASALRFQLPGGLGFRSALEVIIPARPFVGFSASDEVGVMREVDKFEAAAVA